MSATYPAAGVNEWLLRQRDRLKEHAADLERQMAELVAGGLRDESKLRKLGELRDEHIATGGQLNAVMTTWGYLGRMWG